MDIYSNKNLWKLTLFITAVLIGVGTLWYTETFLKELRQEELLTSTDNAGLCFQDGAHVRGSAPSYGEPPYAATPTTCICEDATVLEGYPKLD